MLCEGVSDELVAKFQSLVSNVAPLLLALFYRSLIPICHNLPLPQTYPRAFPNRGLHKAAMLVMLLPCTVDSHHLHSRCFYTVTKQLYLGPADHVGVCCERLLMVRNIIFEYALLRPTSGESLRSTSRTPHWVCRQMRIEIIAATRRLRRRGFTTTSLRRLCRSSSRQSSELCPYGDRTVSGGWA
jgi:hypothetical protein